jgi:hypothetical protein
LANGILEIGEEMFQAKEEDSQSHRTVFLPRLLIGLHNLASNLLERRMRIEYGHNGRKGNDVVLFR